MAGPVVTQQTQAMCPHGGQGVPTTPSPRVTVSGTPAITIAAPWTVAGCSLAGSGGPFDATAQWTVGATRVTSSGQPLAITTGTFTALSTGSPMQVVPAQTRVVAS